MPDHHKVPKANSVDEVRSSESSTAGDPAPAGQVKPTVEHKPRTSKEAKSDQGDPQVNREGDDKDEGVKPNIDIIADTLIQVLKKQLPRDAEIHDIEKV